MDIARCRRGRARRVRRACLPGLLLLAGCATTVPLQTASTVPVGTVRASGQAFFSIYCGFSDLNKCAYGGSSPELRLSGRTGVHDRVDLGASLQFVWNFDAQGPRVGGTVDGKVELWRSEIAPGRKQVISAGAGLALSGWRQQPRDPVELGVFVPLRYGYQFENVELFLGGHFLERLVFGIAAGNGPVDVPAGGFSIGFVSRKRAKFGLAFNYEAPLRYFDRGAITFGIGFLFDLGKGPGNLAPRDPPVLYVPEVGQEPQDRGARLARRTEATERGTP